jgi:nitroreductase
MPRKREDQELRVEFDQVVAGRRTIREFASTPVPPEAVLRVLEAGLKAPTYNHLREWDFVVLTDMSARLAVVDAEGLPERCDVAALQHAFEGQDPLAVGMYVDAIPKQKRMLLTAPGLVVVVYKPKMPLDEVVRVYDLNGLASAWCCIENVLLALADEGMNGVAYVPQNTPGIKTALGIPEGLEVAALVAFGFAAADAKIPPQKGVELSDKLHRDVWGRKGL